LILKLWYVILFRSLVEGKRLMIDFILGWINNLYSDATGIFCPGGIEDTQ
jgi:hypothetical protein